MVVHSAAAAAAAAAATAAAAAEEEERLRKLWDLVCTDGLKKVQWWLLAAGLNGAEDAIPPAVHSCSEQANGLGTLLLQYVDVHTGGGGAACSAHQGGVAVGGVAAPV